MAQVLLQCIGRAVVKHGCKALLGCLPFGASLYDIASDALDEWKKHQTDLKRRAELEELAQMTADQVRAQAEQAAAAVVKSPKEREALAGYLARLPGVVRRSLARPDDMTGRTVPAALPLDRPEDLVPFLPPRPPRFHPGDQVHGSGSWRLEELLGVGGFGEVWKACSLHADGQEVRALKFCFELEAAAVATLKNEVQLLERLGPKDGIVALRGKCLDANPPFVVYDYIPGGDLTRLINGWHRQERYRAFRNREVVRLLWVLANYLDPVHGFQTNGKATPMVHRDLKPANILLQPTGQAKKYHLRIADFGIGGLAAQQALERATSMSRQEKLTNAVVGAHSELYAPFEQKAGSPPAPTDDVYALGIIGYQVLTGDVTAGPPADWKDELQDRQVLPPVIAALGSCMADNPADRPAAAAALAALLVPLLHQLRASS